jgi:hypothetical protein
VNSEKEKDSFSAIPQLPRLEKDNSQVNQTKTLIKTSVEIVEEDLEKSGLSWQDVEPLGWSIVKNKQELKETIGFSSIDGQDLIQATTAILKIPYPGTDFARVRLYPAIKGRKYLQPKGVSPRSYILTEIAELRNKAHKPLIITEGEKKTLCLTKNGYNAIGLPGVWQFKNKNENESFSQELEAWDWKERTVYICFDSDAKYNASVLKAEIELGLNLYFRKAKVFTIRLPQSNHAGKMGVDDYITQNGIEAFQRLYAEVKTFYEIWPLQCKQEVLTRLANMEDKISPTTLSSLLETFAKLWGISKQTLRKEYKQERQKIYPDEDKKNLTEILIELGEANVKNFFSDQYNKAYAIFKVNNILQIWPIRSRTFKLWLQKLLWQEKHKAVYSEALNTAINSLEANALFNDKKIELTNRTALYDSTIYYDLTNEKWQAVKITVDGWSVIDKTPVLFRRYEHQDPQCLPDKDGDVAEVLNFINLKDEDDQLLVLVTLITYFIPDIQHVAVILYGAQGSGKSTALELIRSLVDPSKIPLQGLPRDNEEAVIKLQHHYCYFLDNLSHLPNWLNDILCSAITGGGNSKRKLYTDEDEEIYSYKRCIALNGINCVVVKPDLLDRSILLELNRTDIKHRSEERKLNQAFKEAKPRILAGIFNALSKALAIYPNIEIDNLPRMSSYARWGYAVAEALGESGDKFLQAYWRNIGKQTSEILNDNLLALAVIDFMQDKDEWNGIAGDLLKELQEIADDLSIDIKDKQFPKQPNTLTRKLNTLKVTLEQAGIEYTKSKHTEKGRLIFLRKVGEISSIPSALSVTFKNGVKITSSESKNSDDKPAMTDDKKNTVSWKMATEQQNNDSDDTDDKFPNHLKEENLSNFTEKDIEVLE